VPPVLRLGRILRWIVIVALLAPPAAVLAYRFLPPPVTPLMLLRQAEGLGLARHWVDGAEIAPALKRAVIAAEDARFCQHRGFDWQAIEEAWDDWQAGERQRGASTITQQTAKNLFLWPGGGWLRKAAEAYPTALLELIWPKRRILEVYLNVAEWGPGIYGAEAAARASFGHGARSLTAHEAALMAAVLPNPRRWSPAKPSAYIQRRAQLIQSRMAKAPSGCR
jgi:monofunctional biosynthetic peptidoglycan transglycosylase